MGAFAPIAPIGADLLTNGIAGNQQGLAFDAAGHLRVSSSTNNNAQAYQVGTNAPIAANTITNLLSAPSGIAFDGNGRLWVASNATSRVTEYTPGTNLAIGTNTISTTSAPNGIAISP